MDSKDQMEENNPAPAPRAPSPKFSAESLFDPAASKLRASARSSRKATPSREVKEDASEDETSAPMDMRAVLARTQAALRFPRLCSGPNYFSFTPPSLPKRTEPSRVPLYQIPDSESEEKSPSPKPQAEAPPVMAAPHRPTPSPEQLSPAFSQASGSSYATHRPSNPINNSVESSTPAGDVESRRSPLPSSPMPTSSESNSSFISHRRVGPPMQNQNPPKMSQILEASPANHLSEASKRESTQKRVPAINNSDDSISRRVRSLIQNTPRAPQHRLSIPFHNEPQPVTKPTVQKRAGPELDNSTVKYRRVGPPLPEQNPGWRPKKRPETGPPNSRSEPILNAPAQQQVDSGSTRQYRMVGPPVWNHPNAPHRASRSSTDLAPTMNTLAQKRPSTESSSNAAKHRRVDPPSGPCQPASVAPSGHAACAEAVQDRQPSGIPQKEPPTSRPSGLEYYLQPEVGRITKRFNDMIRRRQAENDAFSERQARARQYPSGASTAMAPEPGNLAGSPHPGPPGGNEALTILKDFFPDFAKYYPSSNRSLAEGEIPTAAWEEKTFELREAKFLMELDRDFHKPKPAPPVQARRPM
ncbi:hypothetical protein DSO57_1038691 [Entomophthora muscae]|uniref:Uncharacterized protein n=1 Tax=Entomophthora muscae TaxID=34485 RepID=A0ACC2TX84_9FUNG|nr:hypothetical protein DSO57_1038691 [Entomophthora muscae]